MNAARKLDTYFTYADYCRWPDEQRWELIHGEAYAMTAPLRIHQKISGEIFRQIGNYLQDKPCEPYIAPFDVRLPKKDEADEKVDTVVQPDIAVICDPGKLDDKGCRGAPDWVIEVLSPSTALKDMNLKRDLYQTHGVREYWLIHPAERWLMVYRLNAQGLYALPEMFALAEATPVGIFDDLHITWEFLPDNRPQVLPAPR
jgi:Uma2 family endonuclease